MQNIETTNGVHYFIDFFGCDTEQLGSLDFWKKILPQSLEGTPMVVLYSYFYEFDPQGLTGFLLLSSSHISVHTWPENGYAACDVFSCAPDAETKKVIDFLLENIRHEKVCVKKETRGYLVC